MKQPSILTQIKKRKSLTSANLMYDDKKVYFKLFMETNDKTVDFEKKIVSLPSFFLI